MHILKRKGNFLGAFFLFVIHSSLFHLPPPSDFTVSEDAGIEPRTVATSALAVRRSLTTRLDLI